MLSTLSLFLVSVVALGSPGAGIEGTPFFADRKLLSRGSILLLEMFLYSETLNNECIGRIYQMLSWQFFNELFTILNKFQYLGK